MRKVLGAVTGEVQPVFWAVMIGFCLGFANGPLVPRAWADYQPAERGAEPAPVSMQIDSLRREVSDLRAEIKALIIAMQAMEQKMIVMERELTALRAGGGGRGTGPGTGTSGDPAGSDPFSTGGGTDSSGGRFVDLGFPHDQPLSSPESAFLAAVKLYDEAFQDSTYETPRDKINHVRRVRQWAGRTDRTLTGQISWVCELQNIETLQSGAAIITIQVVNPADRDDIWSQPHALDIPRRVATSLKRMRSSAGGASNFIKIVGIFKVKQVVDEALATQALFEEPYLVGPFVTFQYEIDVKSVASARIRVPVPGNGG